MQLTAPNGDSIRLDLLGYQFAEPQTNEYDANWLRIKLEGACARGHWTSVDPSLLTGEVAALADWLERLGGGDHRQREIEFIEPNLSFHLTPPGPTFRVYFELESRPPWARSNTAPEEDLWLTFPVESGMLRAAANSLREQLQRYPRRECA